jgi:hypothetical protein
MSAGDEGRRVNMLHPDRLSATALLTRTMTARVAAAVAPLVQSHGRRQQVRDVAVVVVVAAAVAAVVAAVVIVAVGGEISFGPSCVSVGRCKLTSKA